MPTFLINRSKLLEECLELEGWVAADGPEELEIDFVMWDAKSKPKLPGPERARLMQLPASQTQLIDNKRQLWLHGSKDPALREMLPETYLSIDDAKAARASEAPNQIYFLKKGHTAGGIDIECGTFHQMLEFWNQAQRQKDWLLQKGVPCKLIGRRKWTLRIYVLLKPDGSAWCHEEGLCIIHGKEVPEFDSGDEMDREVHVDHKGCERMPFSSHEDWGSLLDPIVASVRQLFIAYSTVLNPDRNPSRYHLFGLDFIITPSSTPILIEVNQFPNLSIKSDRVGRLVKRTLFADIYTLLIAPHTFGLPVEPGGFRRAL